MRFEEWIYDLSGDSLPEKKTSEIEQAAVRINEEIRTTIPFPRGVIWGNIFILFKTLFLILLLSNRESTLTIDALTLTEDFPYPKYNIYSFTPNLLSLFQF
jgi:hypothetical protein